MAIYKIFPTKDATLYSRYKERNTGLDSIIEAGADSSLSIAHVSRYLIEFDQTEINSLFTDKIKTSPYQVNLINYVANIQNLNIDTAVETFALAEAWDMGTGHFNDSPETTNGCSWLNRTATGPTAWTTTGFSEYITASFNGVSQAGGGAWYTGSNLNLDLSTISQSYSYSSDKDLNLNVTNILRNWYSHSLDNSDGFKNNGFIIKQTKANEFVSSRNKQANLQFYSVDTNTIYPPELQFKWDDFTHTTSSGIPTIDTTELVVSLDNNPEEFRTNSVHKFRMNCRPQFPARTYTTSSYFTQRNYLPTSSFYAVKDLDTNDFVINFDDTYTKISADVKSNFFTLYMRGLEPERYYKLLFKVVLDGETIILDDNYYFKIING